MLRLKQLLIVVVSSLLLIACNQPTDDNKATQAVNQPAADQPKPAECKLTMGWDPWEPYMYLMPGDKVSGLDIEIIEALANEANCSLEFIQDDWMHLLQKVEKGEVDLVAGASITEKRKEYALFSDAYRTENFVLYIRQGERSKFGRDILAMVESGKKVGVTTDYIYGDEVTDLQDNETYSEQFVYATVDEENYFNLLQHTVDVIIDDPFVGAYNLKRKGITEQIEQLPMKIYSGDVHLMFSMRSVDHTIVERFNAALEKIKGNNQYNDILQRYML
ncbi:MAG: transporter substrate-binding domain-containing protein [Kangiellaceae bacterium]|jgi:polar amino acid transport system substrate-binding protein|nr:transporter substrate-binding domain-containing protein [Kangiellaceae bacterium]